MHSWLLLLSLLFLSSSCCSAFTIQRSAAAASRTVLYGKGKVRIGEASSSKVVSNEDQRKSDGLADELLRLCQAPRRDISAINGLVAQLRDLSDGPAQSKALLKDWRLAFVTSDEVLGAVGTGLHKVPFTRMEDTFITFGGSRSSGKAVETIEVLRVLGPFPNVRNTLTGTFQTQGPNALSITYSSLVDGTGKQITSGSAATDRAISIGILFAGTSLLVLEPKTSTASKETQLMIFAKEDNLEGALSALRV